MDLGKEMWNKSKERRSKKVDQFGPHFSLPPFPSQLATFQDPNPYELKDIMHIVGNDG